MFVLRAGRATTAAFVVAALLAVIVAPAQAQSSSTPGLAEARSRADAAAGEMNRIESELGEIDEAMRRAEADAAQAQAQLDALSDDVAALAVRRYMQSDTDSLFLGADLNSRQRAQVLASAVASENVDALDQYRANRSRLDRAQASLGAQQAREREQLDALTDARRSLDAELARLESLERERLEAERRQREAEARRAAEAAAEAARQREAARQATSTTAAPVASGSPTAGTSPAPSATNPPSTAAPTTSPPPSSGSTQLVSGQWVCPVQGPRSFVDSWGFPRPGGRRHQGVDIMSPRGTPVVTPVSGTVSQRTNTLGGLSFYLNGDDGNYYYGAHMDSYAPLTPGHHPAGTLVGYVGDTGDARGTGHHLHFEIHVGGRGNAINPYPTTAQHC